LLIFGLSQSRLRNLPFALFAICWASTAFWSAVIAFWSTSLAFAWTDWIPVWARESTSFMEFSFLWHFSELVDSTTHRIDLLFYIFFVAHRTGRKVPKQPPCIEHLRFFVNWTLSFSLKFSSGYWDFPAKSTKMVKPKSCAKSTARWFPKRKELKLLPTDESNGRNLDEAVSSLFRNERITLRRNFFRKNKTSNFKRSLYLARLIDR